MDANKLVLLKEIGYQIAGSCGLCQHSMIQPGLDWGTCSLLTYEHAKHTDPARQLSINRHGRCDHLDVDPAAREVLSGFSQFLTD